MVRLIIVFIHVTGAAGVFGALAIEGAMLLQIGRAADATQRRLALKAFGIVPRVAIPSLLVTLVSGTYLTATVWGWRAAWIDVALLSLMANAVIGAATTRPVVSRLQNTAAPDDRHGPILRTSFIVRTFLLVGIVFLMTVKPPLTASLIAMATAAGVGLLASLPGVGRASQGSMVSA